MKNIIIIFVFTIAAGIIETALLPLFIHPFFEWIGLLSLSDLKINIILIITIFSAFTFPILEGAIVSVIIGYIADNFYPGSFGLYTFIYLLILISAKIVFKEVYLVKFELMMIITFCFTFLESLLILLCNLIVKTHLSLTFYEIILPEAILNTIFAPIVFSMLNKVYNIFGQNERDEYLEKL